MNRDILLKLNKISRSNYYFYIDVDIYDLNIWTAYFFSLIEQISIFFMLYFFFNLSFGGCKKGNRCSQEHDSASTNHDDNTGVFSNNA